MADAQPVSELDTYLPDLTAKVKAGLVAADDAAILLANTTGISLDAAEMMLALGLGYEFDGRDRDTLVKKRGDDGGDQA